jgi:hypothetical protein
MATTISIPAMLTHELVDRLAALSDQENGVAEIALSALDAESLALLGKCGVIEEVDTSGDEAGEIVITAYGRQVIDECAAARDDSSAGASDSSARVPATLTDELVDRLAALADQPEGVAEVALSALRYGSLASLMAHGVIEPIDTSGDEAGEIHITNNGRQLIEACAELRRHVMRARLCLPTPGQRRDRLPARSGRSVRRPRPAVRGNPRPRLRATWRHPALPTEACLTLGWTHPSALGR